METEKLRRLTCPNAQLGQKEFDQTLFRTLHTGSWRTFRRMADCKLCEALSSDYGIDEMPWDERSHQIREASPYVWLSIEYGRFEPPAPGTRRALSLGSDLMDDVYFDTPKYTLYDHELALRSRKRWDAWRPEDPATMRRLLVQSKKTFPIDPLTGTKLAAKLDVRRDGPNLVDIERLVADIPTGFVNWGGMKNPLPSVQLVHKELSDLGVLESVGAYQNVLQLKQKVFIRSLRRRYHLGMTNLTMLLLINQNGYDNLKKVSELARSVLGAEPTATDADQLKELAQEALGLADGSTLATQVGPGIVPFGIEYVKLTPNSIGSWASPATSPEELEKLRSAHEQASTLLHATAAKIRGFAHRLAGVDSSFNGDSARLDQYIQWLKSIKPELGRLTTWTLFLDTLGPQAATGFADFKASLVAQGLAVPSDDELELMGRQLKYRQLVQWSRQVEAAGTAGLGVWFDWARAFHVPNSYRETGNFLIDTMDLTGMFQAGKIEAERFSKDANGAVVQTLGTFEVSELSNNDRLTDITIQNSMIGTTLVNEVQIELGLEAPYKQRIEELKKQGSDTSGPEFILGEYLKAMDQVAELKRTQIMEQAGQGQLSAICPNWSWNTVENSKGETALGLLKEAK